MKKKMEAEWKKIKNQQTNCMEDIDVAILVEVKVTTVNLHYLLHLAFCCQSSPEEVS